MPRNASIDYLRNFANLCRCIIHAAIPYMVTETPIWPVNDKGALFFDVIVFEIHLFVMELFFVILTIQKRCAATNHAEWYRSFGGTLLF